MGQLYILYGTGGRRLCQRETLGQFTGLLDKDGKEIYEGDIITDITGEIGIVKFGGEPISNEMGNKSAFGFYLDAQKSLQLGMIWPEKGYNSLEIVGNIYENPKLLTNQPSHL
ncbi:MAG: YopX family protein [Nanoarchaeota archaeon]